MREQISQLLERGYDAVFGANIPVSFGKAGFVMRSRRFVPRDLDVDMRGKSCLITGANSGLGFAAAKALAGRGATVVMLCRDQGRGQRALADILEQHPDADCQLEILDVASASSLREFLQRFQDRPVDVLINNAGVLPAERQVTAEGHELAFATNLLGPFVLIRHLHAQLERSAGRVINVSSGGMYLKRLDVDALIREDPESYDGVEVYANTKRALVIVSEMWAHELRTTGIRINAMHPGWVDTPAVESSLPRFHRLTRSLLRDWNEGADTIVWLAVCQRVGDVSGKFFFDRAARRTHLVPWTRETPRQRQRLWQELWSRSQL